MMKMRRLKYCNIDEETNVLSPSKPFHIPEGYLGDYIIHKLNENAHLDILVDGYTDKVFNGDDIKNMSLNFASALIKLGIKEGDAVVPCMQNNIYYAPLQFATVIAGAVSAGIYWTHPYRELKVHMERMLAKVVICSVDNKDMAIKVAEETPTIKAIFVLGLKEECKSKTGQPILPLEPHFASRADIGDVQLPVKMSAPREEAIAYILPSSGTTGYPKGVIRSHLNCMAAFATFDDNFDDQLFGGTSDIATCHQPMPHASGSWTVLYSAVYGIKTIVYRGFDAEIFCSFVEKYKVTHAFAAPSHLTLLLKFEDLEKYDTSSIRQMTTGGSPLPNFVAENIFKKLKSLQNLRQGYGSSEAGMATSTPMSLVMPETSGTPTRVNCIRIADRDTEKILGPNEVGEVQVKGPEVFPGYWKNEEATRENFTQDGWLKTGDAGYFNNEGLLFIVDRYKDVIKVDTQQVAPAEIESLLLRHEFVQEAAVIGVPNEDHGEVPKAFVVLKPQYKDRATATEEIRQAVDAQVGDWKKLRGGIHLLPKMPLISLGKIDKKSLRLL